MCPIMLLCVDCVRSEALCHDAFTARERLKGSFPRSHNGVVVGGGYRKAPTDEAQWISIRHDNATDPDSF